MSYENVKVKIADGEVGLERLSNGRIEATVKRWEELWPHQCWNSVRLTLTQEQAAELGEALLRWSKCTPPKNSKPRKKSSASKG